MTNRLDLLALVRDLTHSDMRSLFVAARDDLPPPPRTADYPDAYDKRSARVRYLAKLAALQIDVGDDPEAATTFRQALDQANETNARDTAVVAASYWQAGNRPAAWTVAAQAVEDARDP